MDVLPYDILEHIQDLKHKQTYKKVIQEFLFTRLLKLKGTQNEHLCCANCAYHGSPCMNCAESVYNGHAGPGFCFNKRIYLPESTPHPIALNMMIWGNQTRNEFITMYEEDYEWYLKYLPQHWESYS